MLRIQNDVCNLQSVRCSRIKDNKHFLRVLRPMFLVVVAIVDSMIVKNVQLAHQWNTYRPDNALI